MTQPDPGRPAAEDAVGGLGEEAVKLLYALRDLAGDPDDVDHSSDADEVARAAEAAGATGPAGAPGSTGAVGGAEAAASVLRGVAASAQRLGDHLGTGGESCCYCPVCQAISLVRATPPEVRHQLAAAGTSLLRAVASLMATPVPDDTSAGSDSSAGASRRPPAGPQPSRGAGDDEWEDD